MNIQSIAQSEWAQQASEYYARLSARDQLLVKLVSVFLLIVFGVFGLMLPSANYNSSARAHYQESVDTLSWMQANQHHFAGSHSQRPRRDPSQSLLGIANNSSKKFNISFKRFEPVGDDGLSLWLDAAVFNNMIVWLELLDKRYGIVVKEIAVDRQDDSGLVNVRLVLQG